MKHVTGFLNSAGTRITAAAFSRVQSRRSAVIVAEQISTSAVSIVHPFVPSPKGADVRTRPISPRGGCSLSGIHSWLGDLRIGHLEERWQKSVIICHLAGLLRRLP